MQRFNIVASIFQLRSNYRHTRFGRKTWQVSVWKTVRYNPGSYTGVFSAEILTKTLGLFGLVSNVKRMFVTLVGNLVPVAVACLWLSPSVWFGLIKTFGWPTCLPTAHALITFAQKCSPVAPAKTFTTAGAGALPPSSKVAARINKNLKFFLVTLSKWTNHPRMVYISQHYHLSLTKAMFLVYGQCTTPEPVVQQLSQ